MFRRTSRSVDGLDLGAAAVRHLLVHAVGLGDQPRRAAAGSDFLADADHGRERGMQPWLMFGLLWGIAGLTNTALLSFLPVSGLWSWYHRAKLGKRSLGGVVLATIIFAACITPWFNSQLSHIRATCFHPLKFRC